MKAAAGILAALLASGTEKLLQSGFGTGSSNRHDFDMASIMHARRNNQRNKNQKRLRGMGKK